MGVGLGVDALHHALQGGAGAYFDKLGGTVGHHVLHGGSPADGRGELLVEVLLDSLRVADGQGAYILIAGADRGVELGGIDGL